MEEIAFEFKEKKKKRLRVSTKYPRLTKEFFYNKGITQFSLVQSHGSTEVAPFTNSSEIINNKPKNWTKKDFRGEGQNNNKKILTRSETERDGLIFKNTAHRKKYKDGKLQCSICKKYKILDDFPNDKYGTTNKKRSNCSECDTIRSKEYYWQNKY